MKRLILTSMLTAAGLFAAQAGGTQAPAQNQQGASGSKNANAATHTAKKHRKTKKSTPANNSSSASSVQSNSTPAKK